MKNPIKKWWFWTFIAVPLSIAITVVGIIADQKSEKIKPTLPEGIEISAELDYKTLYENKDDYTDKWVRVFGEVDTVGNDIEDEDYLTFKISGIFNSIRCDLMENQDLPREGDYIIVVGKVGKTTLGTMNLEECVIESVGDEAKVNSDRILEKQKEEKEVAEKENRDNFINSCEEYVYKDVARNPNSYKNKKAKFRGKVIQVMENDNDVTYRINVTAVENKYMPGGYIWEDTIYVDYTRKNENESRVLEEDIIVVYGNLNGLMTYETVLGNSVSIPWLKAEYVEIETES